MIVIQKDLRCWVLSILSNLAVVICLKIIYIQVAKEMTWNDKEGPLEQRNFGNGGAQQRVAVPED